ncbi:MAG: hypothetical protein Kow00105_12490 [Phycisphaeraceae bacterium]
MDASVFDEQMKVSREWFWSDPHRNKVGRLDLDRARAGCVAHALEVLGVPNTELADEIATWFTARRIDEMQPFDGALQALERLRQEGVKLGLISNGKGETQREKVVRFGLEPLFDSILLEGEFGLGKPDPRVFEHVLEELGAKPTEAWMVGDNLRWEVAAPQAMGMKGIWVDWRGQGLPADTDIVPDRIVCRIAELVE